MTIEEAISWLISITEHEGEDIPIYDDDVKAISIAIETMRKYQMFQADYNVRLKADMVAMLTEIQMEIREYHEIGCDEDCNNCCMVGCIEPVNVIKDLDIIQQKIDKLKEVEQ